MFRINLAIKESEDGPLLDPDQTLVGFYLLAGDACKRCQIKSCEEMAGQPNFLSINSVGVSDGYTAQEKSEILVTSMRGGSVENKDVSVLSLLVMQNALQTTCGKDVKECSVLFEMGSRGENITRRTEIPSDPVVSLLGG